MTLRKFFLYYLGFNLLFIIIHLSSVSFFAFIHFLLKHNIQVIENWIFENSWGLAVFSKLCSFIIFYFVIKFNDKEDSYSLKEYLEGKFRWPDLKLLVLIVFYLSLFPTLEIVLGANITNRGNNEFSFSHIEGFLGPILFYLLDFILISYLFTKYEFLENKERIVTFVGLTVLFLLTSHVVIPYQNKDIFLGLHLFTLLWIGFKRKSSLSNVLSYAILIGVLSMVLGIDPIWGSHYSFFSINKIFNLEVFILWAVGLFYLKDKRRIH